MTYEVDDQLISHFHRDGAVVALCDLVSMAPREKVVRLALSGTFGFDALHLSLAHPFDLRLLDLIRMFVCIFSTLLNSVAQSCRV